MSERKRSYETTFIVNASLDDAQIDVVIGKVQDLISKNEGAINEINRWGRRRLAYPIQKKNNGFYVTIEYGGTGEVVTKLDRHFHLEENVLRYLTVQLTDRVLAARQQATKTQQTTAAQETPEEAEKVSPAASDSDSKPL